MLKSANGEPPAAPLPDFVVPPTIKQFKWRDDIFIDKAKKRMSVEIQRHNNFGSLDPGLYPKDYIPECDEITDDYLPEQCRGKLWVKFAYDAHEECLAVGLVKLRFVPKRLDDTAPDVVVVFTVLPNERRQFQSRVYEATTDRDFTDDDECFVFQVPQAMTASSEWALRVRLFDTDRRGSPIGGCLLPLAPVISALLQSSPINSHHHNSSTSSTPSDDGAIATGDDSSPTSPRPSSQPQHSPMMVIVRCLELSQVAAEDEQMALASTTNNKSDHHREGKTTPNTTPNSSPSSSTKIVRKLMAMNNAFQQQLALAGVVGSKNGQHAHHTGVIQMSFCYSGAANRLSISIHEFKFTCRQEGQDASTAAIVDEEHAGLECYAKVSLFEHGNRELKSKRTRTIKTEKSVSRAPHSPSMSHRHHHAKDAPGDSSELPEHQVRFIELVVFKDLPEAEHLLINCGLRIQVFKTSLVARDKAICRSFIGSAIFCRAKELSTWEEIITNKSGEPLAFQIRLNPVFEQD